jgi:hypothetical protein
MTTLNDYQDISVNADVCSLLGIAGVTHVDNNLKNQTGALIMVFRPMRIKLDITVVVSNRMVNGTWISEFAWQSYDLMFETKPVQQTQAPVLGSARFDKDQSMATLPTTIMYGLFVLVLLLVGI